MQLILCEKGKAAKSMAEALGEYQKVRVPHSSFAGHYKCGNCYVTYLSGHFFRLANPADVNDKYKKWSLDDLPLTSHPIKWLPIDVSSKVSPEEIKIQTDHIRSLYKHVNEVVVATDSGQEGQVIADVFLEQTAWQGKTTRLWLSSWEPATIKKQLNNKKDNAAYSGYTKAGIARAYCDQLVGINLTRLYTLLASKAGHNIIANTGTVRSPLQGIIVRNDELINNHKASFYYTVDALLNTDKHSYKAEAVLPTALLNRNNVCDSKELILSHIEKLSNIELATVISNTETFNNSSPPIPFNQNTLSQYCSENFSILPKETLTISEKLYEDGYLSYPRTVDTNYESALLDQLPDIFSFYEKHLPFYKHIKHHINIDNPKNVFDDTKNEEHSALYTTLKPPLLTNFSENEKKIYFSIAVRFLTQFSTDKIVKHVNILLNAENNQFKIQHKLIHDHGWATVDNAYIDQDLDVDNELDNHLINSDLNQGRTVKISNLNLAERKTKSPSRITVKRFQAILEDCYSLLSSDTKKYIKSAKLGTPATQNTYLDSLVKQEAIYIENNKYIHPTKKGRDLVKALPDILTYPDLRAMWEMRFEEIRKGTENSEDFIQSVVSWLNQTINDNKNAQYTKSPTLTPCPICNSALIRKKRTSNNTDWYFWSCSGCDYFCDDDRCKPIQPMEGEKEPCPKCIGKLKTKISKDRKKKYLKCIKCKHVMFK